jgi:hypothetical protein
LPRLSIRIESRFESNGKFSSLKMIMGVVMLHQIVASLLDIIFPVAALLILPALCAFSYFFDQREYGKEDEERIYEIAKFNRCSEFHVFAVAGKNWHITGQRIEHDFNRYLSNGSVPFYVRDFIRAPIPQL